jgi:uncharacterized membrane protein HdeD (DUF308 family)
MTEDMQAEATATMDGVGKLWWLWLVAGIAWLIIGYVIFQYDEASITAVGLLIGVMFLIAGLQYVIVGTQVEGWNWLWYIFGGVLIIGGLAAMFNPQRTFVSIANILGFIFLMVGIIWIIEAFAAKDYNDLWWLTLIAGILMILLAIWLGNRFIFAKAETLLIFAGVWAMMRGIIDIINAFHIRKVGKLVAGA